MHGSAQVPCRVDDFGLIENLVNSDSMEGMLRECFSFVNE